MPCRAFAGLCVEHVMPNYLADGRRTLPRWQALPTVNPGPPRSCCTLCHGAMDANLIHLILYMSSSIFANMFGRAQGHVAAKRYACRGHRSGTS